MSLGQEWGLGNTSHEYRRSLRSNQASKNHLHPTPDGLEGPRTPAFLHSSVRPSVPPSLHLSLPPPSQPPSPSLLVSERGLHLLAQAGL